ncbi:MAG: hypothetical protein A3J27_01980 [Candidatus Tectomicrobia bacterium RIFCSPLOWO2_12_FULL_69_37]|nr:MAG: hypothetical protein A3I72_09000 [Candidatus Tectomicrobia bacterium RIFCSPLOWO2_02_FULL_70_19]OGL65664.1 MAG: hypothetical protein A3J27_01980 [Candidatus Tectomicrobia bacterium RIFCSPLOWO2_12_FULL_69_37]
MSQSPLKVALVGIGWWSTPVGHALKRSRKLDLAACFDQIPERRAAFAKEHGCAEAGSYEAILADPSIEGVLLIVPNQFHEEMIAAAFRAGKHVSVEKPLTNFLAEAPGVYEAWRASGKVLAVGHCYRRAAGHRKMKELIGQGAVGRPLWAEAVFSNPLGLALTPDKWRYFRATCPGGPLMQMGVHHCDTLNYLMGRPVRVTGVHKKLATPAEIDDVTMTIVEYEGGLVSSIMCSFVTPGVYTIKVHGTGGVLSLEMIRKNQTLAHLTNEETTLHVQKMGEAGWTPVPLPDRPDMILEELDEFADCVRTGRAPETGFREAVEALAIVEGACRSAETGRAVEVAPLLEGYERVPSAAAAVA